MKTDMTQQTFGLAGVMGWPVAHSRSPQIHNYWLQKYGIKGAYVQLAVQPGDLAVALPGLSALGFRGCNITIPHKVDALKLVHEVDGDAVVGEDDDGEGTVRGELQPLGRDGDVELVHGLVGPAPVDAVEVGDRAE